MTAAMVDVVATRVPERSWRSEARPSSRIVTFAAPSTDDEASTGALGTGSAWKSSVWTACASTP